MALPTLANAGITVNGSLGTASVATTIAEGLSASPPSGTPALSLARTTTESRTTLSGGAPTPIEYLALSSSTTVTIAAGSALSFTLPQLTAGVTYDLAVYVAGGWVAPWAGPGTVSGSTVTLSPLPAFTLTATAPLVVALYSVTASATSSPAPTATPTAAPTASPTAAPTASPTVSPTASPAPTPTPTPVASPTSLTFDVNNPAPQSVGVSEPGNSAAFTAALACTENPPNQSPGSNAFVAELTSSSTLTPSSSGGAVNFTLLNGNETGSCTLTVTDAHNASVTASLTNSATSLNIFSTRRK